MKNLAPIFVVIASLFFANAFAQPSKSDASDVIMDNSLSMSDASANNNLPIVAYHVEERINMPFGSHITTYEVSSLSLVSTNDLGPNNVRIVTPKYAKVRATVKALATPTASIEKSKMVTPKIIAPLISYKFNAIAPIENRKYVDIDVLGTYERVLDKGYKSVDMFKKVGDKRFFGGDLVVAAKWYSQLFAMTTDLDPIYFYRYAESLKSVGLVEKATEMMTIFENKNSQL
jgi:hypothetical protein